MIFKLKPKTCEIKRYIPGKVRLHGDHAFLPIFHVSVHGIAMPAVGLMGQVNPKGFACLLKDEFHWLLLEDELDPATFNINQSDLEQELRSAKRSKEAL